MSRRELTLSSRRLLIAVGFAAAAHAGLYFAIPAVLRLQGTKTPEYGGTVLVQLEELPPAAPVVTELPPPPPPPPQKPAPEPQAVPEPQPAPRTEVQPAPAPKPAPKPAPRPAATPRPATRPPATQAAPVTPLVTETPAPVPTGPAFKEAGQKTGVSAPISTQPAQGTASTPQAVPGPEPTAPAVGSPKGTAQAGTQSVQRSGVAVAVPSPTAKPAGSTTTGSAPGSTAGTSAARTLDLGALDKALAGGSAGGTATARSGTSSGSGNRDISVAWDDPDAGKGRELLSAEKPKLPRWVSEQGLTLKITIAFTVLPDGVVARASASRSSGYADVDAAVLDAVRRWRFSAADTTRTVGGTILYTIRVD